MREIPRDHPRYKSLVIREKLVKGFEDGIVVPQGLIAHGRGECFDYLIGEKTLEIVEKSYEAAAALLLISKHPVIAVNGNSAALAYEDIGSFAEKYGFDIEVNLFHYDRDRVERIASLFKGFNVKIHTTHDVELPTVSSYRRLVSRDGIYSADTVFVMIEDGDMPLGLKRLGKRVIAVDLNPLSRTSRDSDITIIDNLVRVFGRLEVYIDRLLGLDEIELKKILEDYDNKAVLREVLKHICKYLSSRDII